MASPPMGVLWSKVRRGQGSVPQINQKANMESGMRNALVALLVLLAAALGGCAQSIEILEGATHACGNVHVEGYFTDTQGDIILIKAPNDWTPEQVAEFCSLNGN